MRPVPASEAKWIPGTGTHVRTRGEVDAMRAAGRTAADTLLALSELIRPGVTTADIDHFVFLDTRSRGGTCATLGYKGYPLHCCISVNEIACHGIPGPIPLSEGDIVNVDVTTVLDGWHGDTSATFYVSNDMNRTIWRAAAVNQALRSSVTGMASDLVVSAAQAIMDIDKVLLGRMRVTEGCRIAFEAALSVVRPGARVGDIGSAVQSVAGALGLSVVESFAGHGIGRGFHEAPVIPHFGKAGTGMRLKPGMTFTVEPILALGSSEVEILGDGWTAVTCDRSPTAQFEHTLHVTQDGCEILTARSSSLPRSEV